MEENRYSDFYEGTPDNRLKNILDVMIYNLRDVDLFEENIKKVIVIVQNISWSGISGNELGLSSFLEKLIHKIVENKHEIPLQQYKIIEKVIEPTEIIITELKMAYEEK